MILNQTDIIERYPNGKLKYTETRAIIAPLFVAQYPNRRKDDEGRLWIRVGANKKFSPSGKLEWEINYTQNGDVLK